VKYAAALLLLGVAGCAGQPTSSVTLQQAMIDTVDAIEAANKEAAAKGAIPGLEPCSLTASFSVSSSGTVGKSLSLGVGAPLPVAGATLGGSGTAGTSGSNTVGN
jgi:hypothetical protein